MDTPRSIGRYEIKRWLASGAMGQIYEAYDPVIQRTVAIKVLRRELIERGDAAGWLDRFRQEARAAGRLLHANIVTVLDYGEQDGAPFLTMEYVEGESLDVLLKRSGRLPYRDAISVITQTLSALEFAHANGVVHRDIKPSNILLMKSGLAKIADFGIAHIEASELTSEGDVLGTPSYMAPEQLAGRPVDHRADLFAAAAVLFELLSGVKPFRGKSLAESMLNMETRGPADICTLNPEVSPALKRVLDKALAYDPEQRYASAVELSRAIAAAADAAPRPVEAAADMARAEETVVLAPATPAQSISWPGLETETIFGDDLLAEVERDLATFIGPLARIRVRRSAKTIRSLDQLYQALATHIDDQRDRASFLAKGQQRARVLGLLPAAGGSGKRSAPSVAGRSDVLVRLAPDALNRIEAALTEYIGPIARVVLRQQLSRSASLADFYRDVAAYIPDERDRARFLATYRGG